MNADSPIIGPCGVRPVKDSVSGLLPPPQLDDSWAGHRYVQVNRNTDDVRDGNHNNPDRSFRQSTTHKAWQSLYEGIPIRPGPSEMSGVPTACSCRLTSPGCSRVTDSSDML